MSMSQGLPDWPRYTSANGETMCLNEVSEVKNDPDREARKALKGHEPWL